MRHFYSSTVKVEVDECPGCTGFWLDYGELRNIREKCPSDIKRTELAHKYIDEIFGIELAAMTKASTDKAEAAKKISRMFRFICPSNYIPGKQKWGAF
jgi:Zn-finger nucleic acid-binding protein